MLPRIVVIIALVAWAWIVPGNTRISPAHAAPPDGIVAPSNGPPGTVFSFTLSGFYPGEEVGIWLEGPDQSRRDLNQQRYVASDGGMVWLTWASPSDLPGGMWLLHARGFATRYEVSVSLTVEGPEMPATLAASFLVQPASRVQPGAMMTFVGRGRFVAGEQIASWFIQPDGNSRVSHLGISADGNGQIYTVWTVPADAPSGNWIFRTRGLSSGFLLDMPFTIVRTDTPGEYPDGNDSPVIAPDFAVTPVEGPQETRFGFIARGFGIRERVELWLTAPDGTSRDFRSGEWIYADQHGEVQTEWFAPSTTAPGVWHLTVRGTTSLVRWEIPFTIVEGSEWQPVATPVARPGNEVVSPPSSSLLPHLQIVPDPAPLGTRVQVLASGYRPGEKVFFWATNPEGKPIPNGTSARANAQGIASWNWDIPADEQPGQWTMTSRGDVSRVEAYAPMMVTSTTPRTSGIQMEPASGKPGTTFTFFATGLYAKEKMRFWLTPPTTAGERRDQPIHHLQDKQTDEQGQVWWTWTVPDQTADGVWHMTARGDTSRVEHIIAFTIERDTPLAPIYGVEPYEGSPGTTFRFSAGDIPTDRASYWLTRPDGQVIPTDHTNFQKEWILDASEPGQFVWEWTAPPDAQPGVWLMVIQSRPDQPSFDRSKLFDTQKRQREKTRYVENRLDSVINHREYIIRFVVHP